MVGLLNLVPRYLPRYGMAPEWARANRPLVLIFTAIAFIVTIYFKAGVSVQGGAYATGVLVLMGSAALAVTLAMWREGKSWVGYMVLTVIFVYTTVVNIRRATGRPQDRILLHRHDHPDVAGLAGDALDRAARPGDRGGHARAGRSCRRPAARRSGSSPTGPTPGCRPSTNTSFARRATRITCCRTIASCSSRCRPGDVSEFSDRLEVTGVDVGGHHVLRCISPAIPNAIAAFCSTPVTSPARSRTPISAGRKGTRSSTC